MERKQEGSIATSPASPHASRLFAVATLAALLVVPLAAPAVMADREPLASQIVVRFVDGLTSDQRSAVLAAHGARAIADVPELDLVIADVSADPARAILSLFEDPNVASADLDRTRVASGEFATRSGDAGWALRRIGAHPIDTNGSATLAVLGSGVDVHDPDLTGRVMRGWSAIGGDPLVDPNGHGTALAAIAAASASDGGALAGVAARGVLVLPIQVLDAEGVGRDSDIVRGIVRAADLGADVILMGFSGSGYSSALQAAIDYAWARGAVLIAPVGDEASAAPVFPAGNARVVGVGATTGFDTRWAGSNRGPAVFLAAPGLEVPSAGGRTLTGTAASAAIVAGATGLLAASDRRATNAEIVGRLARGADAVGPRADVGNGRLDLAASLADRSEGGLVPNGVLNAAGGPFVTDYADAAAPLAGWAREQSRFFADPIVPIAAEGAATPVLVSGARVLVPAMQFSTWSLTGDVLTGGEVLRQRSVSLDLTPDDSIASDHGAFTYGSVSPPAVRFGVLS